MLRSINSGIWEGFLSLLYPPYCKACNSILIKGESTLCTACIADLPRSADHLDEHNILIQRLGGRIPISHASAFFIFRKRGKIQRLMHAFKYGGHIEIGIMLGKIYARELIIDGFTRQWDLIIPVPLHESRKKKRRFNQSEEFGKGLALEFEIPCSDDIVARIVKTTTQTRKSRLNRWENVRDVFVVRKPQLIVGKRILLVDDIATTGATLEACGTKLMEAGASKLGVLCLARAK